MAYPRRCSSRQAQSSPHFPSCRQCRVGMPMAASQGFGQPTTTVAFARRDGLCGPARRRIIAAPTTTEEVAVRRYQQGSRLGMLLFTGVIGAAVTLTAQAPAGGTTKAKPAMGQSKPDAQ